MSRAATRAFFMLLSGAAVMPMPPVDNPCPPYTKPHHLSANVELNEPLVRVAANQASTTICEAMT